jgi:ribosomal protein S18 acetylase RimI-like enzyme
MSVAIRRVRSEAEICDLRALLVGYEAALPRALRHGRVPGTDALREAYRKRNAAFLAALGEACAGCVAIRELDETTAVLLRLFVDPAQRGRGIARALVVAALAFARECGYRRVVLDTDKERLQPAYALYQSLGFTECEPYGSVEYDSPTFMELEIADDRI